MVKTTIQCVICSHTADKLIAEYLPWLKQPGKVLSICGACIRTYRPDLVWVYNEIANVGLSAMYPASPTKEIEKCLYST